MIIFSQTVGLTGRVISSSQGRYLNTGQHKHRIKAYTYQTSMPWVGFEPTIPAFERAKTVHALDRATTVTGCWKYSCVNESRISYSSTRVLWSCVLQGQILSARPWRHFLIVTSPPSDFSTLVRTSVRRSPSRHHLQATGSERQARAREAILTNTQHPSHEAQQSMRVIRSSREEIQHTNSWCSNLTICELIRPEQLQGTQPSSYVMLNFQM
jgi:hypothetical protein